MAIARITRLDSNSMFITWTTVESVMVIEQTDKQSRMEPESTVSKFKAFVAVFLLNEALQKTVVNKKFIHLKKYETKKCFGQQRKRVRQSRKRLRPKTN